MFSPSLFRTACFTMGSSFGGKTEACIAFGLMAIFLVFLPTGHTVAVRNLAFFSLAFVTLWSVWRHGLSPRTPLLLPWIIFGTVSLFSLTYAFDPLRSLGEIKQEVGYGLLTTVIAATWVRNIASLERLIEALIAGNLLIVGAVLHKISVIDPFWLQPWSEVLNGNVLNIGEAKSIYNGVGNLSTYLITSSPFIVAYAFTRRVPQPWLFASLLLLLCLDLLSLLLTGNRMGSLAMLAQTLLGGYLIAKHQSRQRFWLTLLLTGILGSLLVTMAVIVVQFRTSLFLDDPRWEIWAWAAQGISAHPLTGNGFGRTIMRMADPAFYQHFGLEHTHNMILNKGVQMGVPGMAAFVTLLTAAVYALWPRRNLPPPLWTYTLAATVMSAGVFLKNMTDDFFVTHNALLYWTLAGAVLGTIAENKKFPRA